MHAYPGKRVWPSQAMYTYMVVVVDLLVCICTQKHVVCMRMRGQCCWLLLCWLFQHALRVVCVHALRACAVCVCVCVEYVCDHVHVPQSTHFLYTNAGPGTQGNTILYKFNWLACSVLLCVEATHNLQHR